MLRNKIISILALAMIGLASPTVAFARGGGGGHGGGGFHGGGFRGGGFRGRGLVFDLQAPPEALMHNGSNATLIGRRFK